MRGSDKWRRGFVKGHSLFDVNMIQAICCGPFFLFPPHAVQEAAHHPNLFQLGFIPKLITSCADQQFIRLAFCLLGPGGLWGLWASGGLFGVSGALGVGSPGPSSRGALQPLKKASSWRLPKKALEFWRAWGSPGPVPGGLRGPPPPEALRGASRASGGLGGPWEAWEALGRRLGCLGLWGLWAWGLWSFRGL